MSEPSLPTFEVMWDTNHERYLISSNHWGRKAQFQGLVHSGNVFARRSFPFSQHVVQNNESDHYGHVRQGGDRQSAERRRAKQGQKDIAITWQTTARHRIASQHQLHDGDASSDWDLGVVGQDSDVPPCEFLQLVRHRFQAMRGQESTVQGRVIEHGGQLPEGAHSNREVRGRGPKHGQHPGHCFLLEDGTSDSETVSLVFRHQRQGGVHKDEVGQACSAKENHWKRESGARNVVSTTTKAPQSCAGRVELRSQAPALTPPPVREPALPVAREHSWLV